MAFVRTNDVFYTANGLRWRFLHWSFSNPKNASFEAVAVLDTFHGHLFSLYFRLLGHKSGWLHKFARFEMKRLNLGQNKPYPPKSPIYWITIVYKFTERFATKISDWEIINA